MSIRIMNPFHGPIALAALLLAAGALRAAPAPEGALATVAVASSMRAGSAAFDGVVEATRQTVLAAQVAGAVVEIRARAGDPVKAGQVLLRLDARAAEQSAAASEAQVQSARAALDLAGQEYERQRQLFEKSYISQGAFERAQAQFKATQAQVNAQLAQAAAARTQSGFYVVSAPYAGVVAEVPVTVGDMAMPGRALVTVYDPTALRVAAMVPQSALAPGLTAKDAAVEIPGLTPAAPLAPARVLVLPTADPATHTVEVRLDLPRATAGAVPGMFARAWLPSAGAAGGEHLYVPQRCIVRHAEMTGLYVVDAQGHAQLRQVRVGEPAGDQVEILAGVAAQERVALDPQAAARRR